MNEHDGPVYEVTLCVDRELAHDLDDWLAGHVEAMLEVPGITGARTYALDDDGNRVRRVTCYQFESDALLEQYLEGQASELRQHTADKFGERFEATRRTLKNPVPATESPADERRCLNCGALLGGQYCGNCGQRASSRLISIWELTRDAFGDLFELDSRLWRTLIPLAIRPGTLTRDYLRGRRARFMPPFRTYIVLSLTFFLIAFFDAREELGILFEPLPPEAGESSESAERTTDDAREARTGQEVTNGDLPVASGVTISVDGENGNNCELDDFDSSTMPGWLARRVTKERVKAACLRVFPDDGSASRGFIDKMGQNVPVGLFILLPVMALVLKILYPLSRRYYVEHLLFVVHYHAFVFLVLSIGILFSRFSGLVKLPDAVDDVVGLAISFYIPIYLFKALRRVYENGRLLTSLKLVFLFFAYLIGLSLIVVFAALFAAFSA